MTPIYVKQLISRLRKYSIVKQIKCHYWYLSVEFNTGIVENWIIGSKSAVALNKRYSMDYKPGDSSPVAIRHEFEVEPDDPEINIKSRFPILQYKELKRACFVEQRVAIHNFIAKAMSIKNVHISEYPTAALLDDFDRLLKLKHERHWSRGDLTIATNFGAGGSAPGRIMMEHFFDFSDIAGERSTIREAWADPHKVYCTCGYLIDRRWDLTRSSITRIFNTYYRAGPKLVMPGVYVAMLRKFKLIPKSVFDVSPYFGTKLIAASAAGATSYFTLGKLIKPEHVKLAEFLDISIRPYDGKKCDVALIDDNLKPINCCTKVVADHMFICRPPDVAEMADEKFTVIKSHRERVASGESYVMLYNKGGVAVKI